MSFHPHLNPLPSRERDITQSYVEDCKGKFHLVSCKAKSLLPRRLWHIFGGLSLLIAGLLVPKNIFLPALVSITIVFLLFELIRLKFPWLNRRFLTCFRALLREREASTLTASSYLLIAASIVFILCDQSIAALALTFVAVGDPVAGMIGELWVVPPQNLRFPGLKVKRKSLRASAVCFVVCVAAGAILASVTHVALWLMVVGAVCATLIEFLSLPLNDNLTSPLVSAGVMSLVKLLFF